MPTTLEQIQYGFDRDSRRTWQRRALSTTQDQHYSYDALSQVSAAARGSLNLNLTAISGMPAGAESWDYDPTGNWRGYHQMAAGASTVAQGRVHDRGNRLTQIEDNPHNMILDRVGRMRQMAPDAGGDWDGRLEITWDAWSRITRVKNNGAVVGEYGYDGRHRRITREVNEETLHSYYNDAWRPVEERKGAETTASISYLWGARHRDDLVRRDRAVGSTTLDETRYVLMDYFNPAAITDAAGEVKERYAFSAFGVRTVLNPDYTGRSSSECGMEFAFQGQFLDTESGLMNYGYRYYSPHLGRWTCKDPIEEEGGMNIYVFASNNPSNYVDWLGWLEITQGGTETIYDQEQLSGGIEVVFTAKFAKVENSECCVEASTATWWIRKHLPPNNKFGKPDWKDFEKNRNTSHANRYYNTTPYTPEGLNAHESEHVDQMQKIKEQVEAKLREYLEKANKCFEEKEKADAALKQANENFASPKQLNTNDLMKTNYPPKGSKLPPGEKEAVDAEWKKYQQQYDSRPK